jgi:hypothetical protein
MSGHVRSSLVAAGADFLVRDVVLGGTRRGLDFDINGLFPDRLIDSEELEEGACVQGIQGSVVGLSTAGHSGRAWANGISRLDPDTGCTGDTIVIRGSKFGSNPPAGVVVANDSS